MKIQHIALTIALLLVFAAVPASADSTSTPLLPIQLYGTISAVDGTPAPVGTVLTATLGTETFTITVTEAGKYGGEGTFDSKLLVSSSTNGGSISFSVGSAQSEITTAYEAGSVKKVDLVFSSFSANPDGDSNGDTGDEDGSNESNGNSGSGTVTSPETQQPSATINYQKVNPGTGTFTYTTSNGAVLEINRMTVFGALYASSHSISNVVITGGGLAINTIDGKTGQGSNGWMYSVNGVIPMTYANTYPVSNGDKIIWYYSESMDSTPETSTIKFGLIIDTSVLAPVIPTETPTIATQTTIPPSLTIIPETKPVDETGLVTLENTKTVTTVQVPKEIVDENPEISVKVVEGNTEEVALPVEITADDVHLILEISVIDKEGEKVTVNKPGSFSIFVDVPSGKQLFVGHKNSIGIWENCPVKQLENGEWEVTYPSLSPFAIILLDEGKENPFVTVEIPTETIPTDTPTTTPTETQVTTPTATETPKSPLSLMGLTGIIAVIGFAGMRMRRT